MAGLIGNLHSARTGMSVSQASIQTTSHNINNINTPGYSRQRVEQSAKSAYSNPGYNSSMGPGQIGTGVQATDVIRIRTRHTGATNLITALKSFFLLNLQLLNSTSSSFLLTLIFVTAGNLK